MVNMQTLLDHIGVILVSERDVSVEEAQFRATRILAKAQEMGLPTIGEPARRTLRCFWLP